MDGFIWSPSHAILLAMLFSLADYGTSCIGIARYGLIMETNVLARRFFAKRLGYLYFILQFVFIVFLFIFLLEFDYLDVIFVLAHLLFILPVWNVFVILFSSKR